MPRLREVIHSHRFQDEIAQLGSLERLDEALRGVTFVLAHCPEQGKRTLNPAIWAIAAWYGGGAEVVVYYSFSATWVVLESITSADPDALDS